MGFKKGYIPWNKGVKGGTSGSFKRGHSMPPEVRKKISNTLKGRMPKNSVAGWFRGKHNYKLQGKNSHFWRGGVTPINAKIRVSLEYKLWRRAVLERDRFACIWCGQGGKSLHADHIKPFAFYPELRFAIDNGRTLCKSCHMKTDTYLKNKL